MIESAIDAVLRSGLRVELTPATGDRRRASLRVVADHTDARLVIEQRKRCPYAAEVRKLIERHASQGGGARILVAPFVASSVGDVLIAAGWCWADAAGNFDIRLPGLRWRQRLSIQNPKRYQTRLPGGRSGMAIVRLLLTRIDTRAPIKQTELAVMAGVSQPRVSQVLTRLEKLELIERRGRRLWLGSLEPLLDRFVEQGDLLRGEVFFGATPQPLGRFAAHVLGRIADSAVSADVALGGMASYGDASHLIVYSAAPPQWEQMGAVAVDPERANLAWRVPEDPSISSFAEAGTLEGQPLRTVDPIQLIADLRSLGGQRRFEAAQLVQSWFLRRRGQ